MRLSGHFLAPFPAGLSHAADGPLRRPGPTAACVKGRLASRKAGEDLGSFATTIAIAIAPRPKPNDDHSNASDLATSASAGGHRRVAVDASC